MLSRAGYGVDAILAIWIDGAGEFIDVLATAVRDVLSFACAMIWATSGNGELSSDNDEELGMTAGCDRFAGTSVTFVGVDSWSAFEGDSFVSDGGLF